MPSTSPTTLIVRHLRGGEPATFQVSRADGKTAEPAASAFAGGIPRRRPAAPAPRELAWSADLRQALAGSFDVSPQLPAASAGALARQALLLLSEDPATRDAIRGMAGHMPGSRQQYALGATVALTTAALIAPQTHARLERDKKGQWSIQIEKKPTKDACSSRWSRSCSGSSRKGGG